jgi:hypothetical protein
MKRIVLILFLTLITPCLARHSVTLPAYEVAQQHGIETVTLINDEGNDFIIPKDSLTLIPTLHTMPTGDQPIYAGALPSATLDTISQALWSFFYARELPPFDIMQHICQDAYLPWLSPEELTVVHKTALDLHFDLLAQLSRIPLLSITTSKPGEKPAHFAVPYQQAVLSTKINDYIASRAFTVNKEVKLLKISAAELKQLAQILWALHEYATVTDQKELAQVIIGGTSWGASHAEQFKTASDIVKTAFFLEDASLTSLASHILITTGTEEQLNGFLLGLTNEGHLRIQITQQILNVKNNNQPQEIANVREKFGFSIQEKWTLSRHDLVNNRLHGTRYDLSDCFLKDLEGIHLLPNIRKVTELILADNKLKKIEMKHLSEFESLTLLDLSHNKLHELDADVLLSLPALRTVKLRGNEFSEEAKQKMYRQFNAKNIEIIF